MHFVVPARALYFRTGLGGGFVVRTLGLWVISTRFMAVWIGLVRFYGSTCRVSLGVGGCSET